MTHVYEAIRGAQLVVFSSPLYFSSLPSQMKAVIDRCQLLWSEARRGAYPAKNQTGMALLTAGSEYKDMFTGSLAVLRHLMNSLGGRLSGQRILCPGLDSCEGRDNFSRLLEGPALESCAQELSVSAKSD